MRAPRELLDMLAEHTQEYPKIDPPKNTVQWVEYIRGLSAYNTPLAQEIANSCIAYAIDEQGLVELIGRYKVVHYYCNQLDGMLLDDVQNIRLEIKKRKAVHKQLKKILVPNRDISVSEVKILMSALVRVLTQFEKKETPLSLSRICKLIFTALDEPLSESNCNLLKFLFLGNNTD